MRTSNKDAQTLINAAERILKRHDTKTSVEDTRIANLARHALKAAKTIRALTTDEEEK